MGGKILVAYASRYGSTGGIAEAIAGVLREGGAEVDVRNVAEGGDVSGYDGAVIGAPVHMGRWMKGASRFAEENREALSAMPVACFAACMSIVKTPDNPHSADGWIKPVSEMISPAETMTFAGASQSKELSLFWRVFTRIIRSPDGDYRDWDAIRAWAGKVARGMMPPTAE